MLILTVCTSRNNLLSTTEAIYHFSSYGPEKLSILSYGLDERDFLFSITYLRHIVSYPLCTVSYFLGRKGGREEGNWKCETDHSPPPTLWSCTSTPLYVFMVRFLVKVVLS